MSTLLQTSAHETNPPEPAPALIATTVESFEGRRVEPIDDWRSTVDPPGLIRKLSRTLALLRYHRPSQLFHRGLKLARQELNSFNGCGWYADWPGRLPDLRDNPGLATVSRRKFAAHCSLGAGDVAVQFQQGRFRFLNHEVSLSPIDWRLSNHRELSHLWRFHFHYHEFLLDAAAQPLTNDTQRLIENAWRFVQSWIDGNPLSDPQTHDDAWHPFCISRRLPVWISLWMVAPPAEGAQKRVLGSIVQQARFLNWHLERDLGGNHLVENLRALAVSIGFLQGPEPESWLRKVSRVLPDQLHEQILEHGEHFERSPMYHALMLDAVLDMRDALERIAPEISELCRSAALRMADFLEEILHPDGEIPLLGDSALNEAPSAELLIAGARRGRPATRSRQAGAALVGPYWIWNEPKGRQLLFDAGPVGADHLPAHAHCDLLNFEMSVAGRRVIVDSGVYNYADDAARQYCRSTAAHNVLQIDGRDQCDVWSRFRMGYRGRPTELQTGSRHEFAWVQAAHDGYRRIGVPNTRRLIACRRGGPWFVVDQAAGTGVHRLTNRLHLHPEVDLVVEDESRVIVGVGESRLTIFGLGDGKLSVTEDWFCPEFGKRLAAPVLVWEATTVLPAVCGWFLSLQNNCDQPKVTVDPNIGVSVHWHEGERPCHWSFPNVHRQDSSSKSEPVIKKAARHA